MCCELTLLKGEGDPNGPARKPVALGRHIPGSVAAIVARLTQDQPATLTRKQLDEYLVGAGSHRDLESVLRELVALGWLTSTPRYGVWAFVAPGEVESSDPYLGLRAWQASDPDAVFALAGEAVAWHLGLIARRHNGPLALWTTKGTIVPRGLRQDVATVTLGWNANQVSKVGPTGPGSSDANWTSPVPLTYPGGNRSCALDLRSSPTSI